MVGKILFICGSLNQTAMLHKIAQHLTEFDCYFTPDYTDSVEYLASRAGMLNYTVLGERHIRVTKEYLAQNGLAVDFRGKKHSYDHVITSSDLIV